MWLFVLFVTSACFSTCLADCADWDHLVFTRQWAQAVCLKNERSHQKPCCYIPSNVDDWTIHGIWPSKGTGRKPTGCPECAGSFDPSKISSLESQLNKTWPTLFPGPGAMIKFWEHEWDKHGRCGVDLQALKDEYHYFSAALDLNKIFNIDQVLRRSGIVPSDVNTYPIEEYLGVLKQGFGADVVIECFHDKVLNKQSAMAIEKRIENFIDNEFVPCARYMSSYDPSVGEVYAEIPDSDEDDVDRAVRAAKKAFDSWSKTPVAERSRLMMKIADLVMEDLEDLANVETRDQGKPVSLARRVDIPRTAHNFRFFATTILTHTERSNTISQPTTALNYTRHEPIGVAGLISPWNLPLYLLSFKIAPAIAAGNTVVCKPSEMTSVSCEKLCKIIVKAGLPAGVVNVVYGTGPRCGSAIVQHHEIQLISFTGSTVTGSKIQAMAAPFIKKLSLELGGKNPAVVFQDADMETCINTCVRSSFTNQGEICLCTSRIFVHKSIYNDFVDKFVDKARSIRTGDPRQDQTEMGALISLEHLEKVRGYVKSGLQCGGKVLCGEGVDKLQLDDRNRKGYFMLPTVLVDVADTSTVMQEEIFGPVTCIVPFESEEEVIRRANEVKYGLCATVWTQDLQRAHRVAGNLKAGTTWVNCWLIRDLNMPFGGYKMSGIGREGAAESLEFFTEAKTVCVQL